MSYIFRSDAPAVGDRVVVRRRFTVPAPTTAEAGADPSAGAGAGSTASAEAGADPSAGAGAGLGAGAGAGGSVVHSDVIGHVLSTDPLVVRPQEIGGYPSNLEAVKIPAEQIQIIKKLSPRMVRNSDIRAVETATAAAFPGKEHAWTSDGQWLMRAGDGVTERSNSATPLGPSAGFSPVPLDEIRAFYARHGLPVQLEIPERIGKPAEKLVTQPGWQLGPEITVMVRSLTQEPPAPAEAERDGDVPEGAASASTVKDSTPWRFEITDQPDPDWLELYHFRGQALPAEALRYLRQRIDGTMGFGRLLDATGRTVAITRGTLTESGDGTCWLGYSAVEVAATHRRRGLGTALGLHMLDWGRNNGAQRAYLQVLSSNIAGIGLYHKLGFIEQHRHRYATEVAPR
ncbi:GNAT family N-acetyltransferase [Corynebacterium lizhenjunii]|uniref:GNAT family N-acetyltransferase n=1 Tax=Corynebacterium lizhenjunii TaxID=2709394 RepID=A0A7T0KE93_9CORY|nr:GNAT family N-acetyltransferase [Corynebacterium lizhenjunii]QPK78929.1 GNAT family N-acetyltransferase [Corynebacterium lizhenjunii]